MGILGVQRRQDEQVHGLQGTADGQSDRLKVLGVGETWPIYLEGMEECYFLEQLMMKGQYTFSHILLDEAQSTDQLQGGGSCTNAPKRWVSLKGLVGRWKIS